MNIINKLTQVISDYKIERMDILQKTQKKEIEYIPVREENTRNKIELMLVDEWEKSEKDKFNKHGISKFILTLTSCVLSYYGVLEKSKTYAGIIFICFGIVLLVNNFALSNTVLKRFLRVKNLPNLILLSISGFITCISITSNYICTRHFTDVQILNVFSALMVDLIPLAFNYIYETNILENELNQVRKQNLHTANRNVSTSNECVNSTSNSLHIADSKSTSNGGKQGLTAIINNTKNTQKNTSNLRSSSRKDIKNFEDMQNAINELADNETITPKKLNMTRDKNYYNWIKKCNNVKKVNGKYVKVKPAISLVKH